MGRNAQIRQYSVHFPDAQQPQVIFHKPKVVVHQRKPRIVDRILYRIRILIKRDQPAPLIQATQHLLRVPTPSKCHIHIDTARHNSQPIHTLLQHHRHVIYSRIIRHLNLLPDQTHPSLALPDQRSHLPISHSAAPHISLSTKPLSSPSCTPKPTHYQAPHVPIAFSATAPSLQNPASTP